MADQGSRAGDGTLRRDPGEADVMSCERHPFTLEPGPHEFHPAGTEKGPSDGMLCHVNLIPWNPVPGTALGQSDRRRVLRFQEVLHEHHVPCTVRVQRGTDIAAACGQLAGEPK